MNRFCIALVALVWLGLCAEHPAVAQQQSTKNRAQDSSAREAQLRRLLQRFPEADADGNGVLTAQEAQAYRSRLQRSKKQAPAAAIQPSHGNVAYGPHERNVLDVYLAKSTAPTPLVVYIHGGGFVAGDKGGINAQLLRGALDAGISMAAINYRFVDGKSTIFPVPQHDGARAVQFLRSKAKEYNLDPERVACFGGSAGAGISLWLGFHDDLADPTSDDPVLRQSTRLAAVGSIGGQPTYDPVKIKELIGGQAWAHPSLIKVYGLSQPDEALHPTPAVQKLYDESSAITHLTKDDPPVFMIYSEQDGPLPPDARPGQGIHHPNFGRLLEGEMGKLGIDSVNGHTSEVNNAEATQRMLAFFKKHLEVTK